MACGSGAPEGVEGREGSAWPVGRAGVAAAQKGGAAEEDPVRHTDPGWASRARRGQVHTKRLVLQAVFRGYLLRKRLAAVLDSAQVDLFEDGFVFPADTEELQEQFCEVNGEGQGGAGEGRGRGGAGEGRGREGEGQGRGGAGRSLTGSCAWQSAVDEVWRPLDTPTPEGVVGAIPTGPVGKPLSLVPQYALPGMTDREVCWNDWSTSHTELGVAAGVQVMVVTWQAWGVVC